MISVCCPHEQFYTDTVFGYDYPDTDTDDENSPDVIQLVPFLSGYGCADTDEEMLNSSLRVYFHIIHKHVIS